LCHIGKLCYAHPNHETLYDLENNILGLYPLLSWWWWPLAPLPKLGLSGGKDNHSSNTHTYDDEGAVRAGERKKSHSPVSSNGAARKDKVRKRAT
jgi:hypothetical protein